MADATLTCRSCGATVDADAVRCPECNTRLRPLRVAAATPEPVATPQPADDVEARQQREARKTEVTAEVPVTAAQPEPDGCIVCGRTPTVEVKLRSVTGMVFAFRTVTVAGRFCRQCGERVFRDRMNRTLLTGWWGIVAFFFNIYVVVSNLNGRTKLRNLGHPQGEPTAPPLDPGKPLPRRAGPWVSLVLILALAALVGNAAENPGASSFAGKCVRFDAARTKVLQTDSCSDSHDGKVVAVVTSRTECPEGTDGDFRLKVEDDKLLCVDIDQ